MKRAAVIAIWVLAGALLIAVCVTAVSEYRALRPVTVEQLATTTTTAAQTVICLNTATAKELQQLPGVGEVLSARIVAYREATGGFRSIEDLLDIEGIGEKRLEEWRPYLTI